MDKHKQVINAHFESIIELDDIMETLSDLQLLNEEGKKVATKIWIETRKETKKETREQKIERIMEDNWNKYDDWTKAYLMANKDEMNKIAREFLNKK